MDRDDDTVDGQNLANQFIWVNIGTSRLKRSKKMIPNSPQYLFVSLSVCYAYKYSYIHHLVVIQLVVYVDGLPFLESLMTSGRLLGICSNLTIGEFPCQRSLKWDGEIGNSSPH